MADRLHKVVYYVDEGNAHMASYLQLKIFPIATVSILQTNIP